ncbi:MAG: sigma-70 family RNA polymerase sigma factor, partial [Microbacterium sp.]
MDAASHNADDAFAVPAERATMTDIELLDQLRGGDPGAYEELWRRHVGVARRAASRMTSADQDDLVSEAFLAVYRQVAVEGKGPRTSFRAYLFTVMRNLAARWYREGRPFVSDPDADVAIDESGFERVEREQDDAQLLDAFRALPVRWQRVLWLSEVEGVARPAIAAELGIRANAVSALQRRARGGLRQQWLVQQLPRDLRDDAHHVAAALPARVITGRPDRNPAVELHLAGCRRCSEAERDLRLAYGNGRGTAVSVSGLAALGVILPTATTLLAAPVSGTLAAGVGLTLVGSAAAVVGALTIGLGTGIIPFPIALPGTPSVMAAAPAESTVASTPDAARRVAPAPPPTPAATPAPPAAAPRPTSPGEEPAPIDF